MGLAEVALYVTYCFCSSNTVSEVQYTGEKLKFQMLVGSVDPSSLPSIYDAPEYTLVFSCIRVSCRETVSISQW